MKINESCNFVVEDPLRAKILSRILDEVDEKVEPCEFDEWEEEASDLALADDKETFYGDYLAKIAAYCMSEFKEGHTGLVVNTYYPLSFASFLKYVCAKIVDLDLDDEFSWSKASALNDLGVAYYTGKMGGEDLRARAVDYYKQAVEAGSFHAMLNLGYLNQRGWFTDKNEDEAFRLYATAYFKHQLYPEACYRLGDAYFWGIGVDVDKEMAEDFYKQAYHHIQFGSEEFDEFIPNVCSRLARTYFGEDCLYEDYEEALKYYMEIEKYYTSLAYNNPQPYVGDSLKKVRQKIDEVRSSIDDMSSMYTI